MRSITKKQTVRHRHIPQRTCVACRQTKAKKELIRIVRTPNGNVELDFSGKKPGRAAYLCPKWECLELGIKKNRLDYTLRTKISLENRQKLLEDWTNLVKGCYVEC